jgi:hypothetical protein
MTNSESVSNLISNLNQFPAPYGALPIAFICYKGGLAPYSAKNASTIIVYAVMDSYEYTKLVFNN